MKDVLLIIPPFGALEFQSLGAHNLQACARVAGYSFDIEYANIDFASVIGDVYHDFCKMNYFLLGERVFAKAAWGKDVEDQFSGTIYNYREIYERDVSPIRFFPNDRELPVEEFKFVESCALEWVDKYVEDLNVSEYKYIGISSSFEQTNATVAILKRVKKNYSGIISFIGGFNCEGVMADGMASLDPDSEFIDYIFSGESEKTLVNFLNTKRTSEGIYGRIISGSPLESMDDIPNLDYSDYFKNVTDRTGMNIVMETSRGCWWGEKAQCRFCGTSDRVTFREKSTKRILNEIKEGAKWGVNGLHMADLIMPEKHLKELLPELLKLDKKWTLYYEQKVSLNLKEMELLKESGVIDIQPGIETLSTDLLKKMRKGTSLKQNLKFLRDATGVGFNLFWNIVWGIPGETIEEYRRINELIPVISHLVPPVGIFHMTLVRYSPYFNDPETFGIKDIEPIPSYSKVFPERADINKLAIIHRCRYPRETILDTREIDRLIDLVENWKGRWDSEITKPRLFLCRQGDGSIILLDTRGLDGCEIKRELSKEEVLVLLSDDLYNKSPLHKWVLDIKAGIVDNGFLVPLVTIDKNIRREYENRS